MTYRYSKSDCARLTALQAATGTTEGFVPSVPKKRDNRESRSQRLFFQRWHREHALLGFEENVLHSVPNGGFRSKVTASIMKAEGQMRGVWDVKLNVARSGKHGLWLEFKAEGGVLSMHQKEFGEAVREQGYATHVVYSDGEAWIELLKYLNP